MRQKNKIGGIDKKETSCTLLDPPIFLFVFLSLDVKESPSYLDIFSQKKFNPPYFVVSTHIAQRRPPHNTLQSLHYMPYPSLFCHSSSSFYWHPNAKKTLALLSPPPRFLPLPILLSPDMPPKAPFPNNWQLGVPPKQVPQPLNKNPPPHRSFN